MRFANADKAAQIANTTVRGLSRHGVMLVLQLPGRFDAGHAAVQANVHQHEIRREGRRPLDGILTVVERPHHRMAQPDQLLFEIGRCDRLIFDDHDSRHVGTRLAYRPRDTMRNVSRVRPSAHTLSSARRSEERSVQHRARCAPRCERRPPSASAAA